ncbi:ExeM/NucH family extracellular endonuclease [Flaviflexus huanghaiensis]|uniref:ExeM/NucH family extracellular endonuclease n=1 Tax=Flaviflexus huanghaiensis TaxID=1111473 RepID=UPI0015FC423C|nr:ExeM/NucH family extracellular endonuclease [Flaviflexus huanghaiensis]
MKTSLHKRLAMIGAGALIISPIWAIPAQAAPDGNNVVINEVYTRGGSAGQAYSHKFIELYNPTDAPIDLSGMSLQYFSATGTSGNYTLALTGEIAADGHFLVQGGANSGGGGAVLPTPDMTSSLNLGGDNGAVALVNGTTQLTGVAAGDLAGDPRFVDFIGYGTSNKFETAPAAFNATGTGSVESLNRTDGIDTDNNSVDFTSTPTPTPQNSGGTGGGTDPTPDPDPQSVTIAEIQGPGSSTPLDGQKVTTRGVVTAVYPTGGFNGFYIQTPGTGGEIGNASHGIFVYTASTPITVEEGQYISVTGTAGEYFGLTQISGNPTYSVLNDVFEAPTPAVVTPADLTTDDQRERLEGMLLDVTDVQFTVTDTYDTNRYGSVALAMDDAPLPTETDIYNPRLQPTEHAALVAENLQKLITLDDGSTRDFTNFRTNNHETPLPYLSITDPVRVGADAQINEPVILDYRFQWNLQPTEPVTGENVDFVVFENTRQADAPVVGGDVTIATFNVLNYFTTLGTDLTGCTAYTDRQGNPISVRGGCAARGAYNAENLARQEGKIVAAIQEIDASIVGIQEIEMSAAFGKDRDAALADLVAALNADAGFDKWRYAASPDALPTDEDVIRLAFIYQVDEVAPTEGSKILIGSPAYGNAREPLGQAWRALDSSGQPVAEEFATINNHFKSKGSGEDDGTGQGDANPDRIAQAQALVAFADAEYGDMPVFLLGDFNSYTAEDPLLVLKDDGYTDLLHAQSILHDTHFFTYTYGKRVGSLDHVFASADGSEWVTDAAVWNINSVEAIALEYSRYNYNVLNLFEPNNPFRSSDHDPIIVGLDIPGVDNTIVVSPVAPTFEDNVITIPEVEGVEYLIDGVVVEAGTVTITEDTTVTARAIEGYVFADDAVTEWTFDYVAPPVVVTPVAPTMEDNVITIPVVEGVEYLIDDAVVTGTVTITEDTVVTARAAEGYVLAEDAVTEWTFEYVAPPVVVTPVAPTFSDNVIIIPEVEGVEYLIDGNVVEAGTVTITEDTTVTARAAEGYVLAEGADTEWTFVYVAPEPEPTPTPRGNVFFIVNDWNSKEADIVFSFGRRGDEVYSGDWNKDGKDTLAVRRGNTFFVNNELIGGNAEKSFDYGRAGDQVLVGDWNGDGYDTFGVRRGNTFYLNDELKGGHAAIQFDYGRAGDQVLVGDWDNDSVDTIMVRRGATFFVNNQLKGGYAEKSFVYGRVGDDVYAGDFDGDGYDTLAVRRGNVFFVNNQLEGGHADQEIAYGRAGDKVLIGDWDGDGVDTPAVNRIV